ncbi:MAG TPA: c-type cytochrome domain-containing protein, partial [Bryobacteraceae bacterium]|nr:c-type cytochrome domain-containing protein [Bryobacteraceae bacterium]
MTGAPGLMGQTRTAQSRAKAPGAPATTASYLAEADQHWAMLKTYCIVRHNAKLKTGGLAFDTMNAATVPENAQTWEKVIRKLRAGMMPPPGMRRPDK